MDPSPPPQPQTKSWSIYTRREIISKYEILERVGSGAYSDVYKARRLSDDLTVALKEVHDYQSAFREIEALQTLQHSQNVVELHEYFWREDEDAVLVLEFLRTDLATVIGEAKKDGLLSVGEIKRWIIQILCGVDACHRSSIVHRDLKPSNLLVSADGVLKLADFGQKKLPSLQSMTIESYWLLLHQQWKSENSGRAKTGARVLLQLHKCCFCNWIPALEITYSHGLGRC